MVRYSHPEMFYLLIIFLIVLFWYNYKGNKLRLKIEKLGIESVKRFILNRVKHSSINIRSRLLLLGIIFILFASTGPQIGKKLIELKRKGVDIFLLIDTSSSMNSTDVKPSRMEKAKYELGGLINQLNGDRVGLIAFAGTSHLHCPLTQDYSAAKLFLNMINTNLISMQGTDLSEAIKLALNHIKQDDDEKYKVIVLVSDGEDHQGETVLLANEASSLGITIFTLGIGTIAGGPIPIYDENGIRIGFKKNSNNEIVTSTLNEYTLNEIANITGGKYVRIGNQMNAISPILKEIANMDKREIKSHVFSEYEDRYQLFLFIGLIFLVIEFLIPTRTKREMTWKGRFSKLN